MKYGRCEEKLPKPPIIDAPRPGISVEKYQEGVFAPVKYNSGKPNLPVFLRSTPIFPPSLLYERIEPRPYLRIGEEPTLCTVVRGQPGNTKKLDFVVRIWPTLVLGCLSAI